jgi:hypothetical protein
VRGRVGGKTTGMTPEPTTAPGPLEDVKRADDEPEGEVQPEAAEVESARLLGNAARGRLVSAGLSDQDIERLADEFIARDRGEDVETFVAWACERAAHHDAEPPPP